MPLDKDEYDKVYKILQNVDDRELQFYCRDCYSTNTTIVFGPDGYICNDCGGPKHDKEV